MDYLFFSFVSWSQEGLNVSTTDSNWLMANLLQKHTIFKVSHSYGVMYEAKARLALY
jgi:hypothetical protein